MAYSFVLKESCQITANMMVAERRRVDRLTHKNQHVQGVPPSPYRNEGGRTSSPPKNYFFDVLDDNGLSKPTDDVGQQARDNLRNVERQAS